MPNTPDMFCYYSKPTTDPSNLIHTSTYELSKIQTLEWTQKNRHKCNTTQEQRSTDAMTDDEWNSGQPSVLKMLWNDEMMKWDKSTRQ